MPKCSTFDQEFARHVCRRFNQYIEENGISDAEAARVLGVRKQMIGPYRKGESVPGSQVLARACVEWGLTFECRGFELSAKLPTAGQPTRPIVAEPQLLLPFDEPIRFRGISERAGEVELVMSFRKVS